MRVAVAKIAIYVVMLIPKFLLTTRRLTTLVTRSCSSSSYKPIRRPHELSTSASTRPPRTAASDPNAAPKTVPLATRLQVCIEAVGPINVAQYMREVLTNSADGYYTKNKNIFGQTGDFITSPEIGQIFGELVAVWLYAEWQKCGAPRPLQLVELGPGRGTLMQDVLRVLSKLGLSSADLSVHLVEISSFLSEVQSQRLCLKADNVPSADAQPAHYRVGETVSGIPVHWYRRLEDVPAGFSVVLAHEFFDALPVHKFQKQDNRWHEVLVDFDRDTAAFRLVASKAETAMLKLFRQQLASSDQRQHVEHSFEMQQIVEHLARRLEADGGFALVMDYGHLGEGADTFRVCIGIGFIQLDPVETPHIIVLLFTRSQAFKDHQLHDPLVAPGSADLTADVDFGHMQRVCEADNRLITFGPTEQRTFLDRLGGRDRLEQLLAGAQSPEAKSLLQSGYEMLTAADQMGARFKFFAMFPSVLREHLTRFPVNGFH